MAITVEDGLIRFDSNDEREIEAMQEITDAEAEYFIKQEKKVAAEFNIPDNFANAIVYLRTRSWHKNKYEEILIKLAHEGKPLPDGVSNGEWAESLEA